jgi:hypothetical protein
VVWGAARIVSVDREWGASVETLATPVTEDRAAYLIAVARTTLERWPNADLTEALTAIEAVWGQMQREARCG